MTLYKYCDLYFLLHDMTVENVDRCLAAAKKADLDKTCAFAIVQTAELFAHMNNYAVAQATAVLERDPEFVHTVISPAKKKTYVYMEKDVFTRFFAANRKKLLKEVEPK